MRAHIVLDQELVAEIDRIAGKRKRSQFIEEAVRRQIALAKQKAAIALEWTPLDPERYPQWATPGLTSKWVHDMRQEEQARRDERRRQRTEQG